MSSQPISPDFKAQRLNQLTQQLGLVPIPLTPPLTRPANPPTFRTAADDTFADDSLKRQRQLAEHAQTNAFKKAFSHKKKTWDSNEIFGALSSHVNNGGTAGVAESLINMLQSTGGNVNGPKAKTGLLTRKRSLENATQKNQMLTKAVQNTHVDMIQVLLPHADAPSLDAALPVAIRGGNMRIVEMLLQYGASVVNTPEGQTAFRHSCSVGGQAPLVAMLLSSPGKPSPQWISRGLVDAAHAGCLPTVRQLCAGGADANLDNAAALKAAIGLVRVDVALALVTGFKPPASPGVNEAFLQLFSHQTISAEDKYSLAELLLLAGANGDEIANSLVQACKAEAMDMIQLLIAFRASIEYQDAFALRDAVKRGRVGVVQLLLKGKSALSPLYATECVELIPKKIDFEGRHIMLDLMLRRGANGKSLHDALIDAVEAHDFQSVKLLLTPLFAGGGTPVPREGRSTSQSMIFARHDVATVDYKAGHALHVAVNSGNTPMVKLLLSSKPSPETLAAVFPDIALLQTDAKYDMTEAFLATGLSGPVVHQALHNAIEIPPPDRDGRLVNLFLSYNPNINFNGGASLVVAILHHDLDLLQDLLKKGPSAQTAANALPKAMEETDPEMRLQMTKLLLGAGAASDSTLVSESLVVALRDQPPDESLLTVLLRQGKGDINHRGGIPVSHAIHSHNPTILDLLLRNGSPTLDTLSKAISSLSSLPTSPTKVTKLDSLLSKCPQNDIPRHVISELLIHEVAIALKLPEGARSFGIVKTLIHAGADVNAQNAAALQAAVRATDQHLVDIIFTSAPKQPTPTSLGHALPKALMIGDPMDRLVFTQRLLKGALGRNANDALIYAVKTYPEDVTLIKNLVERADLSNGEALSTAIKFQNAEAVDMILPRSDLSEALLAAGFVDATLGSNREKRSHICKSLLQAGVRGVVVADALIIAGSESDFGLAATLLENGADVDHKEGQAIIAACQSGATDVLKVLLGGSKGATSKTLRHGFQAATSVSNLEKREGVFSILLGQGLKGPIVDEELVSSIRFLDKGLELVKLFLRHGADVEYKSGEAVVTATRNGFLPGLELLLGVRGVAGQQQLPSKHILTLSLGASEMLNPDTRLTVTKWLFEMGLEATKEVHVALNNAVNEEAPDERLIELLLRNGASPLAEGCKSFVDATRRLLPGVLAMFMELEVPKSDLSWIFSGGFTKDAVSVWFSKAGLEVARSLLQRGAEGDGPASALVTVIDVMSGPTEELGHNFIDMFMASGVDVDYQRGMALQKAAERGDGVLIFELLKGRPSSTTVSIALPHIFKLELLEDDALGLIQLFTNYHVEGQGLDVMITDTEVQPILFQSLSKYPRSTRILSALLDAGYYHDQMMLYKVHTEVEEMEEVTLMLWALLQPQKRIANSVIEMLIERNANPNFSTKLSHTTPLMAAVTNSRTEIVKELLVAGADATVQDSRGTTPLAMASSRGGDTGHLIMRMLIRIHPSINDGSLHTAAARLDYDTVQLLLEAGHEPDFPSTLHSGRSALAELVLHAPDQELTTALEKSMERIIQLLLQSGADPTIQTSSGLSVLLLSLHSQNPVPPTRILLKCGLWKTINSPSHYYKDQTYVYGPTAYLSHSPSFRTSPHKEGLMSLLLANRATNTYYAHSPTPENPSQPPDSANLPADLAAQEQARLARLARIATEEKDHALAIRRAHDLSNLQITQYAQKSDAEDARAQNRRRLELDHTRNIARVTDEVFRGEMAREKARREAVLIHESRMLDASVARADVEREAEEGKRRKMLEWEVRSRDARVDAERKLRAIRVGEREDVERIEKAADQRVVGRISEQKRLVETQRLLATEVGGRGLGGGMGPVRRQIGYVTDVD